MNTLITVIHVMVCLFLILVVLLQAGKGGGMGIAFGGSGGGGSVFGGSGAGNFLTKLTVTCAFLFMFTSMTLAYVASSSGDDPLKALSARSRESAAEREKQRNLILSPDEAPDGADDGDDAVDGDSSGGDESGVSVPGDDSETETGTETKPAPDPAPVVPAADPE